MALLPCLGPLFGNPSSPHLYGIEAQRAVQSARAQVAAMLGCAPAEVAFTSGGTEANNMALKGVAEARDAGLAHQDRGRHIITTAVEHPAILEPCQYLASRGYEISILPVDERGMVDPADVQRVIRGDTLLVSVMHANNEVGTIQPIAHIAAIARAHGALMNTDAAQTPGKIPVAVDELGVDFLTLSGHKIYGPKGIGAVYVRKNAPFCPLIRGGHQERGRRAGTENTIGIVALGRAVELRASEMADEEKRLRRMKEALRKGIAEKIPDVHFVGHPTDSLPGTLNVSFEGAEGEAILLYLDLAGIAVSTGSACASGSLDPSHVILATGLPVECAHGSIRISMGRENTFDDVDYMLTVLPDVIGRIRSMSSAYARRQ
ncbi:MAG TPA: aminotransferase class V-fold PLP-dependent enzyme [Deltaproteobacteria bacterium]|nr:aminotransferase class V-fold PLP-dependent enzyme [Deltaproteobacteria bacterium]